MSNAKSLKLFHNINQPINQSNFYSANIPSLGLVAQQADRCSNIKSLRLFRNINRPLGTPVSTAGKAKSKRYVLRRLLKVDERTDSGRLFQRKGAQELKALAPVLILILETDRVICLFDLSETGGREAAMKGRR